MKKIIILIALLLLAGCVDQAPVEAPVVETPVETPVEAPNAPLEEEKEDTNTNILFYSIKGGMLREVVH